MSKALTLSFLLVASTALSTPVQRKNKKLKEAVGVGVVYAGLALAVYGFNYYVPTAISLPITIGVLMGGLLYIWPDDHNEIKRTVHRAYLTWGKIKERKDD